MDAEKQKKLIGKRIKQQREASKMTQGELSKAVGKSSAAYIAFIEGGERNVSMVDLLKIAKALNTTVASLTVSSEEDRHMTEVKFRRADGIMTLDEEQISRFNEEFKLGRSIARGTIEASDSRKKHIESEAEKTWKESGEKKVPVVLNDIVSALQIPVKSVDIEDTEGFVMNHRGREPYIVYNKNHPRNRQRFTVAHEIGHIVLHSADSANKEDQPSQNEQEREANAFANALLVPREHLKKFLKNKDKSLTDICKKYEVSREVATIAVMSQRGLLNKLKAEGDSIDF